MDSKHFVKQMLRVLILSFIFQVTTTVPVKNSRKNLSTSSTSNVNRVLPRSNRVQSGVFDIILKANSAGKHVPELFQKLGIAAISQARPILAKENVELFQGDIVMTEDIKTALINSGTDEIVLRPDTERGQAGRRHKRGASSLADHKWPIVNGVREVPYVIESDSANDKTVIQAAMAHWTSNVPCITFVPRTTQTDYISIFKNAGCYSSTGRIGGRQRISVGSGCAILGVIAHEIGHALGFWHEQSRPDRDSYIRILWDNIQLESRGEFTKIINGGTDDLGVAYDYNSLMHYGPKAFSKSPGLNTIEKLDGTTDFGQATSLSSKDIEQARVMYCPGTTVCSSLYKDTHSSCSGWVDLGYCENQTYKAFMYKSCKKSCLCRACEDKHSNCSAYVSGGYCTNSSYKAFMQLNCRKGCGLCS